MKLLVILGVLASAPMAWAQSNSDLDPGVYAHFETTEGNFTIELFEEDAPRTVGNFVNLATGVQEWSHPVSGEVFQDTPFYDGLIFHRVISGFMLQGGDPAGTGTGGPGYRFDDEFSSRRTHSKAGILSMANSGPNTNGSQFFITLDPTPHLDNRHSVFGEVIEGMDVVRNIGQVRTAAQNRPVEDVVINKVTIQRVED